MTEPASPHWGLTSAQHAGLRQRRSSLEELWVPHSSSLHTGDLLLLVLGGTKTFFCSPRNGDASRTTRAHLLTSSTGRSVRLPTEMQSLNLSLFSQLLCSQVGRYLPSAAVADAQSIGKGGHRAA